MAWTIGLALPASAAGPVGSINGRLAYASWADGDYDIYTMNADGTDVQNLTTAFDPEWPTPGFVDSAPAWSPDGTKITFTSDRDNAGGQDIWVMDADGSNQVRLTLSSDNSGASFGSQWSPDGAKIAFTRASYVDYDWDVFVMNADGSEQTDITSPNQEFSSDDYSPSFAPDGSRIIFTGVRFGASEILSVLPDGTDEINLTADDDPPYANINGYASYRPDGSKIVYMTQPNDGSNDWDIFVMDPDGSHKEGVLPDDAWEDVYPSWTPDGNQITFTGNRSPAGDDIFVVDYPPVTGRGAGDIAVPSAAKVTRLTSDGRSGTADVQPVPVRTQANLAVRMKGNLVVPQPGDPDGAGGVQVVVRARMGNLAYKVKVANISLATDVTINRGLVGIAGSVVITLGTPNASGFVKGIIRGLDRHLLTEIATDPAAFYVTVGTTDYPGGALRGQLG